MQDQHQTPRAVIHPIPHGVPRPLWSVMIPTYNCAGYLRKTLQSVLEQDPGPDIMQIEVVDDCSTQDDPEAVVAELGRGRVAFHRQPTNVGHIRNFDTCLQRSRGILVHLLHGDDYVRDGFYRTMERPFQDYAEVGAAFCRFIAMDEAGHWIVVVPLEQGHPGILDNWLARIALGNRLQAATMVVRREVYEHLGGFDSRIRYYGEDWEMWVRIAASYPVWYEPEPLAVYRQSPTSLTGRSTRTGENIQDLRRVVEITHHYLPETSADQLTQRAYRTLALTALRRAHRILATGEMRIPLVQLREALRSSCAPTVLIRATALLMVWVAKIALGTLRSLRR